jgi:hypothetical protein
MGRQQFYRGDPSLKQYFLIDDFSGGINTVDVDERTSDNEFRNLLNVELSKKGMIQNRKGWGQFSLLNNFIASKNITDFPANNFALIKVVKNNGNLLQIFSEAQTENLIEGQFTLPSFYELEIMFIYQDNGIKLGLLELYSPRQIVSGGPLVDISSFKVITNIATASFSEDKPLINIETVDYTDFIYFSLSSLNSTLIGFGEYNVSEKSFRIVRDDELPPNAFVYKPNAYEVSKIGFNVLSNNPLTDIAERTGFLTISGLYLMTHQITTVGGTKTVVDTKTPIFSIPPSGRVTLNVLFTGAAISDYNFLVDFFTIVPGADGLPTEKNINYVLDASKIEAGLAQFAVSGLDLQNLPEVNVRIRLFSGITLLTAKTAVIEVNKFDSTAAMSAFFTEAENTIFVSPNALTNNKLFLNKKNTTPYSYSPITQLSVTGNNITFSVDNVSPIFDDAVLTTTKKWVASTQNEYDSTATNLKRSISLQQLNSNTTNFGCNDFNPLDVTSINQLGGTYYLAPTDPVNYIVRVDRTEISTSAPAPAVWQTSTESAFTTAQSTGGLFSTASASFSTSTAIAALTPTQIGVYFPSAEPGTVVRLEGSFVTTKSWEEISNPGSQNDTIFKSMPDDVGCSYLSTYSVSELGLPNPASSIYTNGYVLRVAGRYNTISGGTSGTSGQWTEGGSNPTDFYTFSPVGTTCPTNTQLTNFLGDGGSSSKVVQISSSFSTTTPGTSASWTSGGINSSGITLNYGNSGTSSCPTDSAIISWLTANETFATTTTVTVNSSRTVTAPLTKSFASTSSTSPIFATVTYVSPNSTCNPNGLSFVDMANSVASASSYPTGSIIRVLSATDDFSLCAQGYVTVVETGGGTSTEVCPSGNFTFTPATSGTPSSGPCATKNFTWSPPTSGTPGTSTTISCTTNYRYFRIAGGLTQSTSPRYVYATLTGGTTTGAVLCNTTTFPESYKYFKIVEEGIGGTTPALVYALDGTTPKLYYKFNNVKTQIYYYPLTNTWSTTPNSTVVKFINNIAVKQPNLVSLYLAGTNPDLAANYFRYTGEVTGVFTTDFTNANIVAAANEITYNDVYEIATPENPKVVEQLNTAGFRILEIDSRLVLYKDNIIWFSDLYQFDYIPNYNFIILPLTPDDVITNISYFRGSHMIFTKEKIYKMSGTFGGQDFQVQIVSDAIGCISPYSVKPFNNTLVFMSADGLYRIKQNYYSGGLENVEKIDKQLDNITPYNRDVFAVLNNEQYMLYYKYNTPTNFERAEFNVLKMYYNMSAPQGYPYVKDKNSIQPPIVAKFDNGLYSIKDGLFYKYEIGYTDFLPNNPTAQQIDAANYTTKIRTSKLFFFYPTHDKKLKSVFVKTNAFKAVPIYFNIYIDDILAFTYRDFKPERQPDGTIIYQPTDTPTLEAGNTAALGTGNLLVDSDLDNFNVSEDKLGDFSTKVHKIIVSAKGKGISLEIEQRTDDYFGIQDIGYLYKMGKAREDR